MEATEITVSPVEALEQFIRDEEAFTKAFKHKSTDASTIGAGLEWAADSGSYRVTTPNGSILQLRFFDTVKPIFDYMNVEVPGKESFLSYIEVVVRPTGIKGYMFKSDATQAVWGDSRSKAEIKHQAALVKLSTKAASLGIDSATFEWRNNYDRTAY